MAAGEHAREWVMKKRVQISAGREGLSLSLSFSRVHN